MSPTAAQDHHRPRHLPEQVVSILFLAAAPVLAFASPSLEFAGSLATGSPVIRPNAVTMAIDSPTFCVTDEASRTLDVFDIAGFHRFRTDQSSGLTAPFDGCIDGDGRFVYIETGGRERPDVRRLNFLGEPDAFALEAPFPDWEPIRLALARDGSFLTIDGSGLLTRHDAASGVVVWTLPLLEEGFEQADLTGRPLEGADGTIYVPLTGIKRIAVVSPEGVLESTFGVPGTKRGELAFPVAVAEASTGEILVLDRFRHSVLIYSQDHRYLGESGRIGQQPGDLYHPIAIAASADGRIYIAQGFEGRVQQYRLLQPEVPRSSSES